MSDKDKLTKLIIDSGILCKDCGEYSSSYCAEALAEYLLANGMLVPPCKVGDTVYYDPFEGSALSKGTISEKVNHISIGIHTKSAYIPIENIGKSVFLTENK